MSSIEFSEIAAIRATDSKPMARRPKSRPVEALEHLPGEWSAWRPGDLERLLDRILILSFKSGTEAFLMQRNPLSFKSSRRVRSVIASLHDSMIASKKTNELAGYCRSPDRLEETNGLDSFLGRTTHRNISATARDKVPVNRLIQCR